MCRLEGSLVDLAGEAKLGRTGTFDLHRAAGLWLWALLLVFAWSSVGFNLPGAYRPVTCAVLACTPEPTSSPSRPAGSPRLDWRQAHVIAQARMAVIARREGFAVASERLMFYDPSSHIYSYRVHSDRDPGRLGNTQIRLNGDDGHVLSVSIPTGRRAGDTLTTWLATIHTAGVFGRALQIAITLIGLGIALLSLTGVLVYLRKAAARRHRRRIPQLHAVVSSSSRSWALRARVNASTAIGLPTVPWALRSSRPGRLELGRGPPSRELGG